MRTRHTGIPQAVVPFSILMFSKCFWMALIKKNLVWHRLDNAQHRLDSDQQRFDNDKNRLDNGQ